MDFAMLPPEVNSGRMYAGPGSGPMQAAAGAWNGLAAELNSTAASYQSVVSGLASESWLGSSAASMVAAATPYVQWMSATALQAEQAASQANAAAAAYETAFAMTVPPTVIAANRSLLMALVATNVLGQNTPAIAATEVQYAEMWAQDVAAMYGYAGSSAVASTLTPFTSPPPTTNPAAAGAQGAAVAQSSVSSGSQVITTLPQALQSLASSTAAASPASVVSDLLTAIIVPLTAIDIPIAATSATASATSASASFTSTGTNYRGFLINADRDYAQGKGPYTGYGPGAAMVPEWLFGGPDALAETPRAPLASVAAGLGQANTVGALSVPSGWTTQAPAYRPTAYALPIAEPEATAESVGNPGNLFGNMGLAGAAGGAIGSTTSLGRGDQRIRVPTRANPKALQPPKGEPLTAIAAELSELATRAQSLLTRLTDSGLMTAEQVTEQKRRLLG